MKCFLSHSSKDKAHYASILARSLAPNVEYDEATFEEGMGNLEEILSALDRSSIFVILLSNNSLDSEWVKTEITEAKVRLDKGDIKRFFPIIIDKDINHLDARIPEWVRIDYNLRPITRPTIAAKRIRERLIETSWESHPTLKQRNQIFVGRNSQIAEFERRFDDITRRQANIVFASGLQEIGRKTMLRHALRKASIVRDSYEPIRIDLSRDDNIEGFILKLYDMGISDDVDVSDLLSKSIDQKLIICEKLISDIVAHREIVLIDDDYCIVRYEGEIAPWFDDLVEKLNSDRLWACVASSARPKKHPYVRDDRYYFIHIPELESFERVGLFKRYLEILSLELAQSDIANFIPLLKGYPEQVTYAATLIGELGVEVALKNSHDIANFSIYRASITIKKYEEDENLIDFLRFISSFDFISLDFVSYIGNDIGKNLTDYIDILFSGSVCEIVGPSGNYFRVNEVVRDAIIRDRFDIGADYKASLRKFAENFVSNYTEEAYDVSEYHIAIKESLSSGIDVPSQLLIPAHFLQTMKQLYDERSYREVISLADRVLQSSSNFDSYTDQGIRYYLCQSLARLSDNRFLEEVRHISGPEHDFLFGFYYRLQRRFTQALERYRKAMARQRTEQRARREIVFVLITIEDFDEALSLAKENFERYRQNPYLAQAYFNCVIHNPDREFARIEAGTALAALERMGGARPTEMAYNSRARFEFEFGNKRTAFEQIDQAIDRYPDIIYPLLTKLDMAVAMEDDGILSETVAQLKKRKTAPGHKLTIAKGEAVLSAIRGDVGRAERMLSRELNELSPKAKDKLIKIFRRLR